MIAQTVVLAQQKELCAMPWGKGQESLKTIFLLKLVLGEKVWRTGLAHSCYYFISKISRVDTCLLHTHLARTLEGIPQEELNKLYNVNVHISLASTLTTVLHDIRRTSEMLRTVQIMWRKCQMTPAWLYIFCLFIHRNREIGETVISWGAPRFTLPSFRCRDAEVRSLAVLTHCGLSGEKESGTPRDWFRFRFKLFSIGASLHWL